MPDGASEFLPEVAPLRRSTDYRALYFGQSISAFGTGLTYLVLPVETYELTRSTAMVGLLSAAEFVPVLLVAFVSSAAADHFNRRRILLL